METLGNARPKTGELVRELNTLLATYQVHYQRLRAFHWGVRGPHFFELHRKYEELYTDAAQKIDEIAERILTIGGAPLDLFSLYLKHSAIQEINTAASLHPAVTLDMAALVTKDFEVLRALGNNCLGLAEAALDRGTADMLAAHIAYLEKQSWMWQAWLNVNE